MFELKKSEEINSLIEITKSGSGISGPDLARAHLELGKKLGTSMRAFNPVETTIVAILRGGLFFAEGMYFEMGCKFQIFDPKHEDFIRPQTRNVILVDSVINSGKTILNIMEPDMYIACLVINEKAITLFNDMLYTVRVSKNFFVGGNVPKQKGKVGPDTTMRLFNLL